MQNDDHSISIGLYLMLTIITTVKKKMMEKFWVNFTDSLDILSIWYISSIFILTFTLKHLINSDSIIFFMEIQQSLPEKFLRGVVASFRIVHEEKEDQFP